MFCACTLHTHVRSIINKIIVYINKTNTASTWGFGLQLKRLTLSRNHCSSRGCPICSVHSLSRVAVGCGLHWVQTITCRGWGCWVILSHYNGLSLSAIVVIGRGGGVRLTHGGVWGWGGGGIGWGCCRVPGVVGRGCSTVWNSGDIGLILQIYKIEKKLLP